MPGWCKFNMEVDGTFLFKTVSQDENNNIIIKTENKMPGGKLRSQRINHFRNLNPFQIN